MIRGLKILFKSWLGMRFFFWFSIALTAGSMVPVFFFNEAPGADDYLFQKLFVGFPPLFCTELGLICGCRNLPANKLVRSMPIAKELFLKAVPTFVVILTLGISAVMITPYFIFLGIIGSEESQFADTLICLMFFVIPMLMVSPFMARIAGGGVLVVYTVMIPIVALVLIGGDQVQQNGFGLPVGAAAAMLIGSAALGTAFAYWISWLLFKKSNVKINNAVYMEK